MKIRKARLDRLLWTAEDLFFRYYLADEGSVEESSCTDSIIRLQDGLADPPVDQARWLDLMEGADLRGFRRWRN